MIEKILKDKRILSLYIIVIFSLVIGVTYALSNASLAISFNTALIRIDEEAYGNTTFNTTNIDFKPIFDSDVESSLDNVIKIDFTVGGAEANNNSNIIYDIALADLEIHCDLISKYIKWKLIKDGSVISSGALNKGIKNQRLVLTENQIDLPSYSDTKNGYHNYTFYMWMSDSCQNSNITQCVTNADKLDQSSLIGKYFSGRIEVELYTERKVANYSYDEEGKIEIPDSETNKCLNSNPNRLNNEPNLDNGNLIPVYYDDTVQASDGTYGVWKKANSKNSGNSWYDYENKMWANAVIIGDSKKKRQYQKSSIGTIINDEDITAFYVWIPRFKYRVWNLNRQATSEEGTGTDVYSYPAYTNGIDIEFEKGRNSSGNVKCTYDTSVAESETTLSDTCIYKDSDTITTTSLNTDYTDAWYTHPAFTFGNKEIDGFWMGKFETTGDETTPTILPDISSVDGQVTAGAVTSVQFTTSSKFQTYLSSDINAHMLTNLEWGAVAYLTHSIYGLCGDKDNNGIVTCEGVNHNNSSGYFTGRSGGNIASNISQEKVFYSNDALTTNQYNTNGYYNYKGYKLDSSTGEPTTKEDISVVSSTTKNVTGVYDISGGAYETVMGNMVDSSNQFYPADAGTSWNGNSTLDIKFYNSYSNGSSSMDRKAFNRARLGDATAEVLGGVTSSSAWNPGNGISGATSSFVRESNPWFYRSGDYKNKLRSNMGAFAFMSSNGVYINMNNFTVVGYNSSFRSSLS